MIRGKFRCNSVEDFGPFAPKSVKLTTVMADEIPENQRFSKYTPAGSIQMAVDNPNAVFTPGKNYYVDFTPAD